MNRDALIRLRDAVKAGERYTGKMAEDAGFTPHQAVWITRITEGWWEAIARALALHGAVLPGWQWLATPDSAEVSRPVLKGLEAFDETEFHSGDAPEPARAWLLAILEALIAETPE
jgi:hypothetical protein